MNILDKTQSTQSVVTGRMSDGSDRQITQVTTYSVKVSNNGNTYQMEFDHDPTDVEITDKFNAGSYQDITTTDEKVAKLQADNLTLMDALATIYEGMLMKGTV